VPFGDTVVCLMNGSEMTGTSGDSHARCLTTRKFKWESNWSEKSVCTGMHVRHSDVVGDR
jgi:hypothetical protein